MTHRLVTREYRGQTQLFLEALPVTRPAMITVKLVLGWLFLTGVSLWNLGWLAFWGSDTEPFTPWFLALLTLRTLGFVSFVFLATFVMSMLGRYQIPLYLALFLGTATYLMISGTEFQRFGPVGLIGDRMEFENEKLPWDQAKITLILCAGLLFLIYLLALVREGALAGMLAEKMSQREKVFISVCLLAGMASISLVEKFTPPEPFELFGMRVAEVGRVRVAVSKSQELADYLGKQLDEVCEYLQIETPPKIWVTERVDLDVHRFERAELSDRSSVLLRGNLLHPNFNREAFAAFMIHEFLDVHTEGRVKTEAKLWYWDGFGTYWVHRQAMDQADNLIALRAAVAYHDHPLSASQVQQWRYYRRAVGEDLAQATAAYGIACLMKQCGEESTRPLLTKLFEGNVGADFRATLFEWYHSNNRLFGKYTSHTYNTFIEGWIEALAQEANMQQPKIKSLTQPPGQLELIPLDGMLQLRCNLEDVGPNLKFPISILYVPLKPFQVEPAPHEIKRLDIPVPKPMCPWMNYSPRRKKSWRPYASSITNSAANASLAGKCIGCLNGSPHSKRVARGPAIHLALSRIDLRKSDIREPLEHSPFV